MKMKVLQLIYESLGSPFGFGGAGVRAYEIYKRLKEKHDITLLCMKYPGVRDGDREDLRHIFMGSESRSLTRSVLAYTLKASYFVRKHGHDFDVIVENFLPSTPFFTPLLTKTPVVLQVQGIMERHALKKLNPAYAAPMYLVERFYPALYDRFIFVSEVTMGRVMSRVKRKVSSCRMIPNGIDRSLLEVVPVEGDYILFFSRIDEYTKGLDILVSAFAKISSEFPDVRLVLAGYEFDRWSALLQGLPASVKKRISYAGFVTGNEKVSLLKNARLFVLPSRHESAPISVLEAAACCKPVVVSDIPELAFVGEEGFGLTFSSGSVESLAEMLSRLLTDAGLRRTLGQKAREFSARFLWDSIAMEFEDVLNHSALSRT